MSWTRIGTSLPACREASRNGSIDFEETHMIKNGMAVLTLALAASARRTPTTTSAPPTSASVCRSGFMHVSSTHRHPIGQQCRACRAPPINAEDVLGLDSSDFEPKFQAMVRVGERHRLRFDYFTLDRTGQTTLTAPDRISRRGPADRRSGEIPT